MTNSYQWDVQAYMDQYASGLGADGDSAKIRQNRDHAIQTNNREGLVDQWTRDGRVFMASVSGTLGTTETMSAAGTVVTATAPSIRFTIPAGVVVVPILVQLKVATVIAKSDVFAVVVGDTDTFTSGGGLTTHQMVARSATILSNDAMRQSQVTNLFNSDATLVEAALTRSRVLKHIKRQGQTAELNTTWMPEYNILKGDAMVYIKGPASFLVFEVQETTAAETEGTVMWAELDAGTIGTV